jgi:hypothetical protein
MKFLREISFILMAVCGLTLAVSAQKDDKSRPPKEKPPVVVPGDKKPPQNPPKGDDRPKKPGFAWLAENVREESQVA